VHWRVLQIVALVTSTGCERWGYEPRFSGDGNGVSGVCGEHECIEVRFGENSSDTRQGVTSDTTIEQSDPTSNYGARFFFVVSALKIGLLRFDVSVIPSNAIVVGSKLSLSYRTNTAAKTVSAHRALEAWTEGVGSGNNPVVGAANWDERLTGVAWASPGCGEPTSRQPDAAAIFPSDVELGILTVDVAADVIQGWVDGTIDNFGFVLAAAGPGAGANIHTLDSTDGDRPSLGVTYYTP
jgi:hypothetical protein